MVRGIKDEAQLARVAALLEAGRVDEALNLGHQYVAQFAGRTSRLMVVAGEATEAALAARGVLTDFNATNVRAVSEMQRNRTRMITAITEDQRTAVRAALADGVSRGLNPRAQARLFRDTIGLTGQQEAAVRNYRTLLETGDRAALERALRDRRFDRSVTSALEGLREPLTGDEVDRMVGRYSERWLKFRAETIARTEALGAANAGSHEMFMQAVENGTLDGNALEREWNTKLDGRERPWHRDMNGQKRGIEEPFVSGHGVSLRYPLDMGAPADEVIMCRCQVTVRMKEMPTELLPTMKPAAPVVPLMPKLPVIPKLVAPKPAPVVELPVSLAPKTLRDLGDLPRAELRAEHGRLRDEWLLNSPITAEARDALYAYQNPKGRVGNYGPINRALRSGMPGAEGVQRNITLIDEAFKVAKPLDTDRQVYRTAFLNKKTAGELFGGEAPRVGATFLDKGFTSTSLSNKVWQSKLLQDMTTKRPGTLYNMRIRVPGGTRTVIMSPAQMEAEMLLNRGTRYRVVAARKTSTRTVRGFAGAKPRKVDVYTVDVEVLP